MAVLMTLEVPGGTTAKYDRTNEILGIAGEHDAPPGLITHVCGDHRRRHPRRRRLGVGRGARRLRAQPPRRGARAGRDAATRRRARRRCTTCSSAPGKESNVLVVIDMDGLHGARPTTRSWRAMPAHVGSGEGHPAVMHVAALEPDGHIRVVDLWDSEEAFGEFAQSQIGPAAGDGMPPIDAADRPGLQPAARSEAHGRPERPDEPQRAATPAAPSAKLANDRGTPRRARDRRVERVGEPRRGRPRRPSAAAGP